MHIPRGELTGCDKTSDWPPLVINNLTAREQVELLERLQTYLSNQDILDAAALASINIGEIIAKAQQNLTF